MALRALVVGSQIEGLQGVHNDTERMREMLEARGFTVDRRTGELASRAGILAGYDQLIADSRAGDAAVIYYSGHGFFRRIGDPQARPLQCIAPTDLRHGSVTDWRGITAWELAIKQAQLTARTHHVTVILDACCAAQMSRGAAVHDAVPRALPHPIELGFEAHLDQLRADYGPDFQAVDPNGNRHAVRLIACGQTESAYEAPDASGRYHGAFTDALLAVLGEVGDAAISWALLGDAIRARVQRRFSHQRPDVEGPARRRVFSVIEDDDRGVVAITAIGSRFRLPVGELTGAAVGDHYAVMRLGALGPLAEIEIVELCAMTAIAERRVGDAIVPVDAVAIPLTRAAVKRAVAIAVPGAARDVVADAIASCPTLRPTEPGDPAAIATVRLADGALTVEDAEGPVGPAARFPEHLAAAIRILANLGVAQAMRQLEGEHGVSASQLDIELGTVWRGQPNRLPDHGGALGLGDRIYVAIANRSPRRLFVHLLNVGVGGAVTSLTTHAPAGIALDAGCPAFVFGRDPTGALCGAQLAWPDGWPLAGTPRLDELVVIATTHPASLRSLETRGDLHDGQARMPWRSGPSEGYLVKRLSYLLHPRDAAMAGPAFEIDENPTGLAAACEPEAWRGAYVQSSRRRAAAGVPDAIAIRIADLVVHDTRATLSADIRIDALTCTRAHGRDGHHTWTQRFAGIQDGDHLALDNAAVFLGPVRDFVDLTLWVSRDTQASLDLAQLFAARATSPVFQDAAGALLIAAGDFAAPWVTAVGASAVLARMAYDLVLGASGRSIGLYRTLFLPRERFGVGRHPAADLYRAQGLGFALAVESVER